MAQQQVFISYAWGGESEKVVDEIEAAFTSKGIRLVRDKTDLGFKGLIREFMMQIGHGNLVVLIISDKYLKSKNCMFELLEVEKKGEFYNRIFPIVLPDADIYDSLGIINYLKYWDQKTKELNTSVKELDNLADTRKVQEDINLYTDIRGAIDKLAGKLSNMNTLTVEIMRAKYFQPLVEKLQEKSEKGNGESQKTDQPNKKEGKVLYHIPGMMQVDKWTRCTVRLAWEEMILTDRLDIPESERVIESIRLGNVMQVSLSEGRDGKNFSIQTLNNEEQFIFEDDYTAWLFDVMPLTTGSFTLILRVTLIQIMEGKERKKDIVLERSVVSEAVVPEALAKFETAEKGLQAPKIEREGANPVDEEIFSRSKMNESENTRELDQDYEQPPVASSSPSKTLNPATYPKASSAPPSDSKPSPYPQATPIPQKSNLRKILPYAASFVGLMVVGVLFLGNNDSSLTEEWTASEPNVSSEFPISANPGEKMLLALSLESSTPSGEQVNEVMMFVVAGNTLDSLEELNPGKFNLEVFPASDTLNLNLGAIKELSIREIQDSVEKVSVRPTVVGDQLIERDQLIISTESQFIQIQPRHIDSTTAKKLQLKNRGIKQN